MRASGKAHDDGRVGRSVSYGCSHGNNCIQRSYRDYNWSALTTMISFTGTNLSQVVATARAHGVRVIQGVMYTEHGQPSARFNTSRLEDSAYTAQWVGAAVDQVVAAVIKRGKQVVGNVRVE